MSYTSSPEYGFERTAAPLPAPDYPGLLQNKGLYHFLFWLAYYAFAVSISLSIHHIYDWHFYVELLSLMPPDMALVYLNLYVLIPAMLFNKRIIFYFISLLVSILLQSAISIWLHRQYALAGTEAFVPVMDFNVRNFSIQALNAIYLLGLTMGIKFVKDWMMQERKRRASEKQQVETELNFLKSQIHPHFLFNTLNNLYSLTVQKSELAPEIVLKLSDLMSYMLYESSAQTVPLDQEMANLENYIAIEKLRFGSRLAISLEKPDPSPMVQVPPLILLAFVENSFKHGLKNNTGSIRIEIKVRLQGEALFFSIRNPAEAIGGKEEKNGIGLKNVTRRLDLLYGSRYRLDFQRTDNTFQVNLKIPIV